MENQKEKFNFESELELFLNRNYKGYFKVDDLEDTDGEGNPCITIDDVGEDAEWCPNDHTSFENTLMANKLAPKIIPELDRIASDVYVFLYEKDDGVRRGYRSYRIPCEEKTPEYLEKLVKNLRNPKKHIGKYVWVLVTNHEYVESIPKKSQEISTYRSKAKAIKALERNVRKIRNDFVKRKTEYSEYSNKNNGVTLKGLTTSCNKYTFAIYKREIK